MMPSLHLAFGWTRSLQGTGLPRVSWGYKSPLLFFLYHFVPISLFAKRIALCAAPPETRLQGQFSPGLANISPTDVPVADTSCDLGFDLEDLDQPLGDFPPADVAAQQGEDRPSLTSGEFNSQFLTICLLSQMRNHCLTDPTLLLTRASKRAAGFQRGGRGWYIYRFQYLLGQ